ncbi:MAG TPA: type ISP restriction/modification enzyme, partial [Pirellulales bacterium]|nr:type ISP restriction/modification enzyme [Pirellulales bacterium]
GVMPGRTWVIAPDAESLTARWKKLVKAKPDQKEDLFIPHLNHGQLGDRHVARIVPKALPSFTANSTPIADEKGDCVPPVRYGFRSFDRQWIIPDNRVLNRPNPHLWSAHSDRQIYITAPSDRTPTAGPALTFTALMPDLHHYHGRGGRAIPLWRDASATVSNLPPKLLDYLRAKYKVTVSPDDFLAYLAAIAANPTYTARFQRDLAQPGLRIPLTASRKLFGEAVKQGRLVIWLHTFGERYVDSKAKRLPGPPRLPKDQAPTVPRGGGIPADPDLMPDEIDYDADKRRLTVGPGFIDNVPPEVWNYEISGKRVLTQWFSYRKRHRERPIMGDRRPPSKLCDIQPDHWLAEYTAELLNVLHVLGRLILLEPEQAALLDQICSGPLITAAELAESGALALPPKWRKTLQAQESPLLGPAEEDDD